MVSRVTIQTYDAPVTVKFGTNAAVTLIPNTAQDFHLYPGITMTATEAAPDTQARPADAPAAVVDPGDAFPEPHMDTAPQKRRR